jgi:ABC-type amino acid transport substrate-binding protein
MGDTAFLGRPWLAGPPGAGLRLIRDYTRERTMQRRSALFWLATIVATWVSSAASARSLDDIISAGTIRVGVNPSFATAMLNDKNQLAGFDVDLSNKLAQMLGIKAEFVTLDSQARIPSLTGGLVDIVLVA